MSEIKNVLSIKKLSKTFSQGEEQLTVLNNINLDIKAGEFVAVMGASGSGKSTLLHLIAGLLKGDNGSEIKVSGNSYSNFSDKALTKHRLENIGLIFQNYNLVRSLNITENIRLPLLLSDKKQKQENIDKYIDDLGLGARRNHLPRQLSGGEQQRVAIARAIIGEPELILADEPTGNLDLNSGNHICELLRSIADKRKQTIIMVTHAPHVAYYADRIIMLSQGNIATDMKRTEFADSGALSKHYQDILQQQLND